MANRRDEKVRWVAKPDELPGRVLPVSFFARSTLQVAPGLLGKVLAIQSPEGLTAGRIVETEAYRSDDPASHSCRGRTPRAAIMFGSPGVAYVYYIYGMYEMLNFVTEPEDHAGAVLIRAVEPIHGEELMALRRRGRASLRPEGSESARLRARAQLTAGPGKLCRAMGVKLTHNGESLQGPRIWVLDDGSRVDASGILVSPRVGIRAGTDKFWRYFIQDHPFVSRAPQNAEATNYLKACAKGVAHSFSRGVR